jgi:hypothetical protein
MGAMRIRHVAVTLLFFLLGAGAMTTAGSAPSRQWAIVYLHEPTLIGSTLVQGPVLFVHDEERMTRGEPCTTVQLFEPGSGPSEQITEFHCIPMRRSVVNTFTVRTRPNAVDGFGCVLAEYQFAGDAEGHAVPLPANAH